MSDDLLKLAERATWRESQCTAQAEMSLMHDKRDTAGLVAWAREAAHYRYIAGYLRSQNGPLRARSAA